MAKINWKGSTLLSPVPVVLVSCGDMENSNIITIAWCGIVSSEPPTISISVRPGRHSYDIIKNSGEFCVNLATASLVRAVDICGVKSGKDVDKFKLCKLTKEESNVISCPRIEESPLSLDCKVREIVKLGSHDMFIADIVGVGVKEELIDETGKLTLSKSGLIAYSHGVYMKLGARVGSFGCSVKKKTVTKGKSYGKRK